MLSRGAGAGPSGEPLFPESPVDDGTAAATAADVDDDVIPLEVVVADVGGCFFFLDLFFFFLEVTELVTAAV